MGWYGKGKRWSKLRKQLDKIIDPNLKLDIRCITYRPKSDNRFNTDIATYTVSLNKEIIWQYPEPNKPPQGYPYVSSVSEISNLIREYIDTPTKELLCKKFPNDLWDFTDILKAADKRIGKRRLDFLLAFTNNDAASKIIKARLKEE